MGLLDTLLWDGLSHGDLRVQQPQRLILNRRRRSGDVESRLRGLDPVHRQGSELLEQSAEVVDGIFVALSLRGRLPLGLRQALGSPTAFLASSAD